MSKYKRFTVFHDVFEVDDRYEFIKAVGKGSFGVVCAAKDTVTGKNVAIKKLTNLWRDPLELKRIVREVMLLKHFSQSNVLRLIDIMGPPPNKPFEELYIVTDLMDTDLYQIISSQQELSDDHYQYFLYQILKGLKHLHDGNVLHRDLKPSNLLINENCDLLICDFGLARLGEDEADNQTMTEYVVTRWYRPPELLLSSKQYSRAVDMWSVGCIFAELLGGKPLFAGKDYFHQLCLIIDVLGTPSEDIIDEIGNFKTRHMLQKLPQRKKISFADAYPRLNPKAIDLMEKMLAFDPRDRITVQEALDHPYLSALRQADEEIVEPVEEFDQNFENMTTIAEMKVLIVQECTQRRPGWQPGS